MGIRKVFWGYIYKKDNDEKKIFLIITDFPEKWETFFDLILYIHNINNQKIKSLFRRLCLKKVKHLNWEEFEKDFLSQEIEWGEEITEALIDIFEKIKAQTK